MRVIVSTVFLAALLGFGYADDKPKAKVDDDLFARIKAAGIEGDTPFTLVVTLLVKPDGVEKLRAEAPQAAAATLKEKGVIAYEFHQDAENPRKFVLFEKWKNVAALQLHMKEAHTVAILKTFAEVAAEAPSIQIARPLATGQ